MLVPAFTETVLFAILPQMYFDFVNNKKKKRKSLNFETFVVQ